MCSISEGPELWSRKLGKLAGDLIIAQDENAGNSSADSDVSAMDADRMRYAADMQAAGFDVHEQAERIQKFYLDPCADTIPGTTTGE